MSEDVRVTLHQLLAGERPMSLWREEGREREREREWWSVRATQYKDRMRKRAGGGRTRREDTHWATNFELDELLYYGSSTTQPFAMQIDPFSPSNVWNPNCTVYLSPGW